METEIAYAVCGTAGCENAGRTIPATVPAPVSSALVTCGACAKTITNITTAPPTPDTEVPEWLT